MVNTTKLRDVAKTKGVKLSYICDQFGLHRSYINNLERGKATMSDERIYKVADILGTTYEYLTDQTDDPRPLPDSLAEQAEDGKEKLLHLLMGKLPEMDEETEAAMEKLLSLPNEDFTRTVKAVGALID